MVDTLVDIETHGANATLEWPGALVLGSHEMIPKYIHHHWAKPPGDPEARYEVTDVLKTARSLLNTDAIFDSTRDYADQEFRHMCCFGGVSFKCALGYQAVFQPNGRGLGLGFARVQADLERRAGLGWISVFREPSRMPWQSAPMDCRERKQGTA